jgi:hypothetical protein
VSSYQITVKIKAIVGVNVEADSPEEALKIGRAKVGKIRWFPKPYDYIDGREEVVGITGDWDL